MLKMRNPLKKLLRYNNEKRDGSDKHDCTTILPFSPLDDLLKAIKDMKDMRDCYDSLLSAASAATNTAYEFSDSARQMGVCLLQKIALNDDEEIGEVMLKLGKVQFELQKHVDTYRCHIFQTITVPSESLINELNTVEEMKNQWEEKRVLYDYMRTQYKEKGRSRRGMAERLSQQLQAAKDEFDEEVTLFVFRLKSLKQGQSRSLVTQAVRHHAAQLSFFRKALKALEAVEPHLKLITQQQHIDYQLSGLEDNESEDSEDDDVNEEIDNSHSSSDDIDDGDLSFDHRQRQNFVSETRKTMEGNVKSFYEAPYPREQKMMSQSAPLFPQQRVDQAERMKQLRSSSTRKFHSYELPKPGDTRKSSLYEKVIPHAKSAPRPAYNLYHSSPLEPMKYEQVVGAQNLCGLIKSISKENKNNKITKQVTTDSTSSIKKAKLQSFSGPITSRSMLHKQPSFNSPRHYSGPISISSMTHKSSTNLKVSPPFTSSPTISELHQLPTPPMHATSSSFVGFSGPLITTKTPMTKLASPLPTPPLVGDSQIPSRNSSLPTSANLEGVVSPPLTPIKLVKAHPT